MPDIVLLSHSPVFRAGILSLIGQDPEIQLAVDFNRETTESVRMTNGIYLFSANETSIFDEINSIEDKSQVKILLVSDNDLLVEKIRNSGFGTWGIVSSDTSAEGLKAAIRAVGEGLCVFSRNLLPGLRQAPPSQSDSTQNGIEGMEGMEEHLTAREITVLQQLADGKANKQIAHALGISENTVKFHIASIYSKFRVNSRMEAMIKGVQLGIIAL
jgi:two-component system, NarL family, response regulator YdfI